jgi:sec-independent protein translocase protein TatC
VTQIVEKEMTFLEHLEELRWHLMRSVASIFVFAIAAFSSKTIIFHHLILGPSRTDFWTYQFMCRLGEMVNSSALCIENLPFIIQSRQMTGQFMMHLTSSLVIGLILAFPYTFWEIWRFISPALYPKERRITRGATFFVSLLFLTGVAFGYFIVSPLSINFLANYQVDPSIQNEFDIVSYVSTISMLVLACGIMFQLPVVVYFLSLAGFVNPELMKRYRKHAFMGILILSAILTPPDVFSQLLIAFPLFFLYQCSIVLSRFVLKRKEKQAKKELEKLKTA